MKKFFVFIFAVFYLGLSCGFSYNMHFCMGKFSSTELFHINDKKCGKCGMENKNGCCESKVTFIKITDNQQPSSSGISIFPPFTGILSYPDYTVLQIAEGSPKANFTNTSPPVAGAFICILNCTFTI